MADQSKSKRTSFIGKRLGLGRLVGKASSSSSSSNNNNNNNNVSQFPASLSSPGAPSKASALSQPPTQPSSSNAKNNASNNSKPTPPNRSKKKTRMRSMTNNSKRSASMDTTTASSNNKDGDIEPSARAVSRQQSLKQLLQKQASQKEVTATTGTKPSSSSSSSKASKLQPSQPQRLSPGTITSKSKEAATDTTTTPAVSSDQLRGAECVKIQSVARGFLQRRRTKREQTTTSTTTTTTPATTKLATVPSSPKRTTTPKRKKKKAKKTETGTASAFPAPNKEVTSNKATVASPFSAKNDSGNAAENAKTPASTAAAIKIQAFARGVFQRKRSKKVLATAAAAAAAFKIKNNNKREKRVPELSLKSREPPFATTIGKPSEAGAAAAAAVSLSDHYAWAGADGGGDHYAWDAAGGKGGPTDSSQHSDKPPAVASSKKGKPSKSGTGSSSGIHQHQPQHQNNNRRRKSLTNSTKDNLNQQASKNGSKQKAKVRRLSGLKSSSSATNQNGSQHTMNTTGEYSWKDHSQSMRDQSMKDQSGTSRQQKQQQQQQQRSSSAVKDQSMKDHSMPFHELIMDGKSKESSGSITNPDISQGVIAEEVSNDSDKDVLESSTAHTSKRSSIASSFISKLTEHEDESTLEEAEEDYSISSKDISDALSLRRHDDGYSDQEEVEPDLLDLSVMATVPTGIKKDIRHIGRATKNKNKKRHRSLDHQQDDLSVSIKALSPRRSKDRSDSVDEFSDDSLVSYSHHQGTSTAKRFQDDDFSVSVMAIAEVSDVEGEFAIDYETEYEEYYEYGEGDISDDFSDTVMAVADDFYYDDGDEEGYDDEHDDASVSYDAREDDMSITSCESDLPREGPRDARRRRRRRQEVDDYGDEIIEAEDVSVLSTASHKHRKSMRDNKRQRQEAKRESKKSTNVPKPPEPFGNQFLLPELSSEEEESYLERRRRRRSRRSMTIMGESVNPAKSRDLDPDDEVGLRQKLEEVNRLIAQSRKEMEELMEAECIKIQATFRMHKDRKTMDNAPEMRAALSRTGTKEMNNAATRLQSLARGVLGRAAFETERRSKKRSRDRRNRKQRRALELERKAAKQEAKQNEQLRALEVLKATKLQSVARGFFVRSKDLLNKERIGAIKIQRMVLAALRIARLQKRLVAIPQEKAKQIQDILDMKKKNMAEFEPGKFDNMDTRVKMVNFLKKQIEKENEATEKWVAKIKAVKENNVRLMTSNSANVCTIERLKIDVQTKEDKRDAMLKLNQQWVDGIKEYENRVQTVINNTNTQVWQKTCCERYINQIVDKVEARYPVKKLVKEIKFLASHSDMA